MDNKLIIGLAVLAGAALILGSKKQKKEFETMSLFLPDDFDPESVKGSQDG